MPRSLALLCLTCLTASSALVTLPAHAQKTVEQCANQLRSRGYNIISMDIDDGRIYDFDGIKNNQKYEIKTDMNCKVLLERIDY
jgi:hypothetical protein